MSDVAWRWQDADLILQLYVQPKASRDQWMGLHAGAIKLAITAPPVDGKANAHIQKFLAKAFAVAKSRIDIAKGELNRNKQVRICAPEQIPAELQALGIQLESS